MDLEEKTAVFEQHRRTLLAHAYRMLGSLADAHDLVQDAYLKWRDAPAGEIRAPRAWLVTVVSRLALNRIQSARVRRETYVGTWLPEPFVDEAGVPPSAQAEIDDTVSVALLLALEKLTPAERAAFLLHDVFDFGFDEMAAVLGKTPAACRKLASRARAALRETKPRFDASAAEHERLLAAFLAAAREGDLPRLQGLLAATVELHADGGGKVEAVPRILRGAPAVAKFFAKIFADLAALGPALHLAPCRFNGGPGVLVYEGARLATALSVRVHDGAIQGLYAQRNPEKLTALRQTHRRLTPGFLPD